MNPRYIEDLFQFNRMYGLPVNDVPTYIDAQRLRDLKVVLQKEVDELDDIIIKADAYEADVAAGTATEEQLVELLGDLADFLGDVQVYAGTEMIKWGLPILPTLACIMQSNFSKLGEDGQPIVNEFGKVEKGPNYWKPEPKLRAMIHELRNPPAPEPEPVDIFIDLGRGDFEGQRAMHIVNGTVTFHEQIETILADDDSWEVPAVRDLVRLTYAGHKAETAAADVAWVGKDL